MTLLGGLFSKKQRAKQRGASKPTPDDAELASWSPTNSYVTPDTQGPSVPNGKSYLHPESARHLRTNLNGDHSSQETMASSSNSNSRLRLPFGRKKPSRPLPSGFASAPEEDPNQGSSPRPSSTGRTSTSSTNALSEAEASFRLRPPPSKSAIFAAYADPASALSTRSLPADDYPRIHSELSSTSAPAPRHPKRPSLFAWTKSNPSKTPTVPPKDESVSSHTHTSNDHGDSSFNLKSFRHVVSTSPTRSNGSNVSLPAPIARPRGDSVHSDASAQQRISVAAFREAQARRSMAGSPSPSNGRSPSPLPPSPALGNDSDRSRPGPRPSRSSPHIPHTSPSQYQQKLQQHRKSGMSFATTSMYTSDSDESQQSEEEGEEDSDDNRTYTKGRLVRRGTVKSNSALSAADRMGKARAKSELGHGAMSSPLPRKENNGTMASSPRSHLGHGTSEYSQAPRLPSFLNAPPPSNSRPAPSPQQPSNSGLRPRASNSTSALTPSAAARRASIVAAANATNEADAVLYKRASRHIRDSSIHSNPGEPPEASAKKAATHLGHAGYSVRALRDDSGDSDSDSDNAPLATLIAPRRPGSALSSYSTGNLSTRSGGGNPQKPLIDIKELLGGGTSANRSGTAPTILSAAVGAKDMTGFTGGRTLLGEVGESSGSISKAPSASPLSSPSSPPPPRVESPLSMNYVHPVTSKVPPFKFVSPPATPQREAVRTMGAPRSATMPSQGSDAGSGYGSGKDSNADKARRDALAERLSRVVKKTVDGHSSTSNASSPAASPSPGHMEVLNRHQAGPSPLARGRTTSPEPAQASPLFKPRALSPPIVAVTPPTSSATTANTPSSFSKGSRRLSMGTPELTAAISSASVALTPPPARPVQQAQQQVSKPSPPDQSLADLLGAGIRLISFTGESEESDVDSSDSEESEDYGYDAIATTRIRAAQQTTHGGAGGAPGAQGQGAAGMEQVTGEKREGEEQQQKQDIITPIPIKQRAPLPSFSVTSRPQVLRRPDAHPQQDQQQAARSSIATSSGSGASNSSGGSSVLGGGVKPQRESVASSYSLFGVPGGNENGNGNRDAPAHGNGHTNMRKRSSTLIPPSTTSSTLSAQSPSPNSSSSNLGLGNYSRNGMSSPGNNRDRPGVLRGPGAPTNTMQTRQRSSTMSPMMPVPSQPQSKMGSVGQGSGGGSAADLASGGAPNAQNVNRPFAMRRDSPASSTGDSSSGRVPLTPRDGSDLGLRSEREGRGRVAEVDRYSGGASGLGISTKVNKGKQIKRRSVSFEDDMRDLAAGSGGNSSGADRGGGARASRDFLAKGELGSAMKKPSEHQLEERRKERRRGEAKAAIELGNVINGRGPVMEDEDDDMPINQANQRMSAMNPMMMAPMGMQQQQAAMGFAPQGQVSPGGWGMPNMGMNMGMNMNMNPGMLSPAQFMVPPPSASDPNFLAAHQQAMMYAKQAYQMAVAQQAMAAAADEWERSSNVGGFGGSVYGGSTTGGPPSMMIPSFGMMGQMPMGGGGMGSTMGGGGGNNWSTGSGIFPPSSRPAYNLGISSSMSDYGGGMNTSSGLSPNWTSTRSSYGDFGPSTTDGGRGRGREGGGGRDGGGSRESTYGMNPPMPPIPSQSSGKSNPNPRMRTISQPASPSNRTTGTGPRKVPPPSSWKASGF